ncbi:hypothetical protein QF038_001831 [Pseudarthrobacter sp. W1I19]|uniref:hypothetical protein n=1 Tax=Pseudarthrobacter sp. W1I19 TaxID=3042288 RepID=UPI0027808E5C|nr:hypothetical protein [Pseudarthrobacter sp. W1I19]MDQ0923323.1 hypothetical protein [Pseudarthrobacter sp. W1I19]
MVKKILLVVLLALGLTAGSAAIAQAAVPQMVPTVSVGGLDPDYWWLGGYVDLDRTDQGAVTSGYAAAVAGTICLQTAGWVCPFSAFILTLAAFYIATNGYCPNRLRIYLNSLWGFPMRCA